MESTDKNFMQVKIGIFDSGIGGFSVLGELFLIFPYASYYYVSDDAFAPYGPKSDEFITERAVVITHELINRGIKLIVVACNTATAASIDYLRSHFPDITFVGVEPYLNAYYKMPESLGPAQKKMMVLTTESTGKSERFKRLKERLDPNGEIDHYGLKNLARLIENYYRQSDGSAQFEETFNQEIKNELNFLVPYKYSFAILGCTHYPLIRHSIETILNLKTISPDTHVAQRVLQLSGFDQNLAHTKNEDFFHFFSSTTKEWIHKKRESLYGPFKGKQL